MAVWAAIGKAFAKMGSVMAKGGRKIVKSAKATTKMFKSMKGTEQGAGMLTDLFDLIMEMTGILKPFMPIFKLLYAMVKAFFVPLIVNLTQILQPLYSGMASLVPVMMKLGESFWDMNSWMMVMNSGLTTSGGQFRFLGEILQWLVGIIGSDVTPSTGILGDNMLTMSGKFDIAGESAIGTGGAFDMVTLKMDTLTGMDLGWFDDVIEYFEDLFDLKIGDGGGGGGGDDEFGWDDVWRYVSSGYQMGTESVPRTGLAIVERGERIIPEPYVGETERLLENLLSETRKARRDAEFRAAFEDVRRR